MFFLSLQDQKDYVKASQDAYFEVADAVDSAGLTAISLEDAHRRNNPELFSYFKRSKVSDLLDSTFCTGTKELCVKLRL